MLYIYTQHCFRGLWRATVDGFWDMSTFDPDEYEFYEKVKRNPNPT